MYSHFRSFYRRQQFNPGLLGAFCNPFYLARRNLWTAIARLAPKLGQGVLLDVGCGTKPYEALFNVQQYVGLEIDSELSRQRGIADFFYDGSSFPFASGQFDAILCNQVLEHVFEPDVFLREVHRVLRPGGRLLLTIPFVWDEHEQPWDYARYSSFGLKALLARHGFSVVEQIKLGADASTLFQLANCYLWKAIPGRGRLRTAAITLLLASPLNLLGLVVGKLLPRNPDLFLDNVVLAERVTAPGASA